METEERKRLEERRRKMCGKKPQDAYQNKRPIGRKPLQRQPVLPIGGNDASGGGPSQSSSATSSASSRVVVAGDESHGKSVQVYSAQL